MLITMITTPAFQDIVVIGKIDDADKERIKKIKNTMSFDEYAGYSPDEQKKYAAIINTLKNYKLPDIVILI